MDNTACETDTTNLPITTAELDSISEPSSPFIGQWHTIVSQSNWEKGAIILQWRQQLQDAGVAARLWSDPAWSRMVGEVTPQHVGRLRRVSQRFGEVQGDYDRLYWSHFLAALDWDDAEMWLEGAVQNKWSVSKMRYQRWETMGAVEADRPDPLEVVSASDEEGVRIPSLNPPPEQVVRRDEPGTIAGPVFEGPDFGDDSQAADGPGGADPAANQPALSGNQIDIEATLAGLPANLADPFRQLRQAIVQQKQDDWKSVKRLHVVALINDLRQLLRKTPPADA